MSEAVGRDPLGAFREEIGRGTVPQPTAPDLMPTAQALKELEEEQNLFRAARRKGNARVAANPQSEPTPEETMVPKPPLVFQRQLASELKARLRLAIESETGFIERLVWFWSNHFAVSISKGAQTRVSVGSYEREAIRPHVLGRFEDMLLAVEQHPTMLFYLDNQLSVGPNSPAGRNRRRGLNENLAREILELHTLGVNGGYGQDDVVALAKILTGHQIAGLDGRLGEPGTTVFNPGLHEPGPVTLLKTVYPDTGADQARSALRALAHHPSTARHIARKLVVHFLSDRPDAAAVERLESVFRKTGGDLKAVSLALLDLPQAGETEFSKIRLPQEFVVAGFRLCNLQADRLYGVFMQGLRALGQAVWNPGGPDGFPDDAAHWESAEGIKTRLDVAASIARRAQSLDPRLLAEQGLGELAAAETLQSIRAAESRAQGIAILLMSPEFQRR
ncbi:DUF1800 domain-containing protein [Enterovirga rhinocerotis]|uniref:Uncharacterized protein (DUF1800 family) n=1 Tax=Enterovirga rhinocerotis TaxID=1339210 RepID=A0A4R7C7H4_9HYPH|nr:uncharacterized protein (DUF1800 family) [Enterovirga rhinocerotis]